MKNFRTFKEELIGLARPAAAEKKWKPITTNKANKETWAVNKDAERSAAKKKVAAKRAATKEPEKKLSNYLTAKPPRSLEEDPDRLELIKKAVLAKKAANKKSWVDKKVARYDARYYNQPDQGLYRKKPSAKAHEKWVDSMVALSHKFNESLEHPNCGTPDCCNKC